MTEWLFDTLIWTAALIALVLVLRRPVARWFGPGMAYALWLIPALRLVLPPIELPAWLAPKLAQAAPVSETATDATAFIILDQATPVATTGGAAVSGEAATGSPAPITPLVDTGAGSLFELVPAFEIAVAVWLIGAAIFLWMRFGAYFQLRGELLDRAKEVGRAGRIRLIETPGTKAPLAFGVIDPVIAMPVGFMAMPDREGRDLALAHEMAHHKGGDLLANVLVQPLFALHWFNPLCRYGWLALRRDQEAACDARVVATKPPEERARYAGLIASFAAGPNVALAAPMACPVLGDKSIVHRLRSLKMSDTSTQRRLSGRLMLGAAIIALPLTASITYAEANEPAPPAPPIAPTVSAVAPFPPAPPAPPASPSLAISAAAPAVNQTKTRIIKIDPDTGETIELEDGQNFVVETESSYEVSTEGDVVIIKDIQSNGLGQTTTRVEKIKVSDGELTEEQMEEIMESVEAGLEQAEKTLENLPEILEAAFAGMDTADGATSISERTTVRVECVDGMEDVSRTVEGQNGYTTVYLCKKNVWKEALEGIRDAREEIAENDEMSEDARARILEMLDQQIAALEAKST